MALVGCGNIAHAHARGYKALPQLFRVVAVCDVDEERAGRMAQELGAEKVYHDYRQVADDPEVEAVDVCLPHDLHAPVAIACARAGKHVLVEKPLATSMEEGREMVRTAKEAGVKLMVAFNERYDPVNRRMKELVDEGKLGRIFLLRLDHNQNVCVPEGHWIRSRKRMGGCGGVVFGSMPHRLDLLRWFGGEVEKVYGLTFEMPERMEGPVSAVALMRMRSGATGEVTAVWACANPAWYEGAWVYGTKGSAYSVTWRGGRSELFFDDGERRTKVDVEPADSFTEEIRHFGECILEDKEPLTNGEDALKSLELSVAIWRAAEKGRVVNLPLSEE